MEKKNITIVISIFITVFILFTIFIIAKHMLASKNKFAIGPMGFVLGLPGVNDVNRSSAFCFAVNQIADFSNNIHYKALNNYSSFSEQFAEEFAKSGLSIDQALNSNSSVPYTVAPALYTYLIDTISINGVVQVKAAPEFLLDSGLSLMQEKQKITKAVITIPARFTDAQRQATMNAAKIAGLECVRMIHEPTAAAMAYGLTNRKLKPDEVLNIIVYDFGGGTLDVSVVEISSNEDGENIFTVLGSAGNTHFGGADFDNRLCTFSINRFKKQYNISKLEDCVLPRSTFQCSVLEDLENSFTSSCAFLKIFSSITFSISIADLEIIGLLIVLIRCFSSYAPLI